MIDLRSFLAERTFPPLRNPLALTHVLIGISFFYYSFRFEIPWNVDLQRRCCFVLFFDRIYLALLVHSRSRST